MAADTGEIANQPDPFRCGSAEEYVLERIENSETPVSPSELADEYGCGAGHMRHVCSDLAKRGQIDRLTRGKYVNSRESGDEADDDQRGDTASHHDATSEEVASEPEEQGAETDESSGLDDPVSEVDRVLETAIGGEPEEPEDAGEPGAEDDGEADGDLEGDGSDGPGESIGDQLDEVAEEEGVDPVMMLLLATAIFALVALTPVIINWLSSDEEEPVEEEPPADDGEELEGGLIG